MAVPYYVYVILCEDGSFYTGYTKDLDLRMKLHMNGKGARYTRMHTPKKLVYVEEFDSRAEAVKRERMIKKLNHRQKLELINSRIK
ncbi:MAG: GIY-YIG nuclease family protein [Candidatus Bathyarchaeia archaeon]